MSYTPDQALAWIAFDGTGTPAVANSLNATLTDDGVGLYTINFTVAFASTDYAMHGGGRYNSANAAACVRASMRRVATAAKTTTTCAVQVLYDGTPVNYDSPEVGFVFVGIR